MRDPAMKWLRRAAGLLAAVLHAAADADEPPLPSSEPARIVVDPQGPTLHYDRMIFGGFLEHFDDQVYGGRTGSPMETSAGE